MKYRLIEWKPDAFSKWRDTSAHDPSTIKIIVSAIDPEERAEPTSDRPSDFFWYAPATIPVDCAVEKFIDHEIQRINTDIQLKLEIIQNLIRAKNDYYTASNNIKKSVGII